MGILRIVIGIAIVFGFLYVVMMRNTKVRPPVVEGAGPAAGSAVTGPGQTAEHMKKKFETAAQNAEDHGDEVQKKLDDAVQGK